MIYLNWPVQIHFYKSNSEAVITYQTLTSHVIREDTFPTFSPYQSFFAVGLIKHLHCIHSLLRKWEQRFHDCLQTGLRHDALSRTKSSVRSQRNSNPKHTRRRKRSPVAVHRSFQDCYRSWCGGDNSGMVVKSPGANLVMGQVKILKRGEKLSPDDGLAQKKSEEGFDLVLGSTDRLGPDPETVKKQVRVPDLKDGIYGGSGSVASPPPSSVPVPGFLGKNKGVPTSDLKRLLRLNLV
ncbi:uncharacterized protein LOC133293607 [Gastrolobium bilobum]|uniref:uncharacterized protein LOC133293607 n=1 Tax=Gastrolobium bilobum TaxID=150636 RepID=UPI002AB1F2B3|nr:uncharacterized protein LOC133293607 [Gastrolobium bilobum]